MIRLATLVTWMPDCNCSSMLQVVTAYMDFIRDVVISLSLTRNEAAKFGKDIFNYEKRLAEITPDLVSLQDPLDTYSSVALDELKLRINTVREFFFNCY